MATMHCKLARSDTRMLPLPTMERSETTEADEQASLTACTQARSLLGQHAAAMIAAWPTTASSWRSFHALRICYVTLGHQPLRR